RVRAGGARARCVGCSYHCAAPAAQRDRARDCCGDAGHRRRDHGGGRLVVHRTRRAAADAVVGRHGRRGTRSPARGAVGLDRAGRGDRRRRPGTQPPRRRTARRPRRARPDSHCMTEIAYHPTHVRALRETFKALRTAEFPWTADTIYLNNASIGPIPERTRRALDEFTAKRTAPHLLPDRELFGGLAAARLGVAQLIHADPSEIAPATNTSWGLNLAARPLPLQPSPAALLSDKEFPANVYPWLMLRDQGITVEMARCRPEGWPDEQHLLERLRDPKVRVLAVSFVQFSNGYREIGRAHV